MHEDSNIELEAFPPASRVFCIASAGCTARALSSAGHDVTALDLNPQQIEYARARAAGAPEREGMAERLLGRARALFPALGWTESRRRAFLSMRDPSEQLHYWHRNLDTMRWRALIDTALSTSLLAFAYHTRFLAGLPPSFGPVIRSRLERTWRNHANHSNPYAWRLLLGETPPLLLPQARPGQLRFVCEEAATYLERSRPASFDAFSLSNITDGAPISYIHRLCAAVEHAATPGAPVVIRSFAEPANHINDNFAARDRSMIWGIVRVTRANRLCSMF